MTTISRPHYPFRARLAIALLSGTTIGGVVEAMGLVPPTFPAGVQLFMGSWTLCTVTGLIIEICANRSGR